MLVRDDTNLVGEVHCLNCGRSLAEAIRNPFNGKLRLRPCINQTTVLADVIDSRALRCARCHGKAFIEPVLREGLHVASSERDSLRPLQGVA